MHSQCTSFLLTASPLPLFFCSFVPFDRNEGVKEMRALTLVKRGETMGSKMREGETADRRVTRHSHVSRKGGGELRTYQRSNGERKKRKEKGQRKRGMP